MTADVQTTLKQFRDPKVRQSAALDALVRDAVFGAPRDQGTGPLADLGDRQHAGVRPASIHELYLARGRGEVPPFTTPP